MMLLIVMKPFASSDVGEAVAPGMTPSCFLSQHSALERILHEHPSCIDNLLDNMCTCYNIHDIKARLTQLDEGTDEEGEEDL
jgi:hypothetical protein